MSGAGYATNPAATSHLRWWRRMALAGGLASLVLGLILLIWPEETLLVVAVLLGLWLVVSGFVKVIQSALVRDRSGAARLLGAFAGLLLLVIGALCLRNLSQSLELIAALIAVAWLLLGLTELWTAISGETHGWSRAAGILIGLVTIVGGLVVLFWPNISLVALVWVTGGWFVVLGLIQLALAWRIKPDRANAVAGTPVGQ